MDRRTYEVFKGSQSLPSIIKDDDGSIIELSFKEGQTWEESKLVFRYLKGPNKSTTITKQDKLKNSKKWAKILKEGEEFQLKISHYLNDLGCLYDKYGLTGTGEEKETILSWEDRLKFTDEMEKVREDDLASDLGDYLDGTACSMADVQDAYICDDEMGEVLRG